MPLVLLGLAFHLVATLCFVLVLVHGFKRSLGTGFMVLCIPFYQVLYGFRQFEHRHKGLVLAGWLGGLVVGVVLRLVGLTLGAAA